MVVGEPFARFVVEHRPEQARRISQTQALKILGAEHRRGHMAHAFLNHTARGSFYGICSCCACCCGALRLWRSGEPVLVSSGYVSQVDENLCQSCGMCVEVCAFGALALVGGLATVDADRCMGCGVCVVSCESRSLTLVRDPSKNDPFEVHDLAAELHPGLHTG